jgi:DNA-binding MarR family transcriptional regulator
MAKRAQHFIDRFSTLRRRMAGAIDEVYGPLGVGSTQAKLLRAIGQHQPMSQADLARATLTDPALTGRTLRTLLDRGWVRRRRSRDDRRAFSLELTPDGEELWKRVQKARAAIAARVERSLDASDLAAFDRIVQKLLDAFPE